jgi:hypothetical protein
MSDINRKKLRLSYEYLWKRRVSTGVPKQCVLPI